jgi:two-component system cell cycle sensor histidine kinase/response regulator CckA
MAAPIRLLIVDDDRGEARIVEDFIHASGSWADAEVCTAAGYDDALRSFAEMTFEIAFVGYWLGGREGLALLRAIRQRGIDTPVIVLTSRGGEQAAVEAMKAGAADSLSKAGLTVETVERAIRHALALHAEERQRWQAEAALRGSEERFRALVENSSDALLLIDGEGRINYLSPSSQRLLGWMPEQMVGRSMFDFLHAADHQAFETHIGEILDRPGQSVLAHGRFHHADGSWRTMEAIGVNRLGDPAVAGIVINARDVSDRRRLEEQLRLAQKMEAVGQLAGGIAHDFNNLLTAILGYCHLMLDDIPEGERLRADLLEIQAAGDRAAALTRQLLAFSRRQMLQPQIVNINQLVQHFEKLLRGLIPEHVELVTALAPDLHLVTVDPASVEQILVNLTVNARDAMPAGGRLTIETANVDLDDTYAVTHVSMAPGRYVMLAIHDTGEGMDAVTRARIFEPFFTTRDQGKGSGLGLATVYGIVKQSGGHIWVYSEPGHGTMFKAYLPATMGSISAAPDEETPSARSSDFTAFETVLLVEDEDAVRALARAVLQRHHYVVLEARHGVEALLIAEQHTDEIHLLVTDIVMPHMSGGEVAKRLAAMRPAIKTLFMSGYSDPALVHHPLTHGFPVLQKPFTPDAFARKVRRILDETPGRG